MNLNPSSSLSYEKRIPASLHRLLIRLNPLPVEIKDFGNRGVSDHRLIIALHVVFRLVIACIFAWAVNRDHAGMNTYLMVCAAVIDSMGEAVGQHLSDDRHRNLRCLISLLHRMFFSM